MKNKKTYVLIVAVLSLWGTIGYKIYSGLKPEVPKRIANNFNKKLQPKNVTEDNSFSLVKLERDPFLGTVYQDIKNKGTLKKKVSNKIDSRLIPNVKYNGLIKNKHSSNEVFIVNINNSQYLLKKGQIIDSIKLLSGDKNKISVDYKGNLQTITRK